MSMGLPSPEEPKAEKAVEPKSAMSKRTTDKLVEWSTKLGVKVLELEAIYEAIVAQLKKLYPTQSVEFFDNRARHLMATKFAEQLSIKAEAFVVAWAFDGGKVDTNANAISQAKAMYNNAETRDEAVAKGICFADGRPRDTREWLVEPTPGRTGRKNPRFKKELTPFYQRRVIGLGRKFDEDEKVMKVIVGTLRGDQADLELPYLHPVRMRMNIRVADGIRYGLTSSTGTTVEPVEDALLGKLTKETVFKVFDTAPEFDTKTKKGIKTTIFNIVDFLDAHKGDPFAVTVLEADITRMPDEPTVTGNYPLGVSDVEEDVERRGITCFTPEEIYNAKIANLGLGSRLLFIGTPRETTDIFTQEKSATLNVVDALVKMAISKEESLFEIGAEIDLGD